MNNIRVCVSGYFDPLHVGHIDYLRKAKELGDILIIILNNENQKNNTRTLPLNFNDRRKIIESIKYVDEVFESIDNDENVIKSLEYLKPDIFAKGSSASFAEVKFCKNNNIEIINNVGSQLHIQDLLADFRN